MVASNLIFIFGWALVTSAYHFKDGSRQKLMYLPLSSFINPRRACVRVTVIILSVSWCVCYYASCYIPHLFIECWVPLSFLCWSQHIYNLCGFHWKCLVQKFWRHFLITSALLLFNQLSMDKSDSGGFLTVCRTSDSSYDSNDSQ